MGISKFGFRGGLRRRRMRLTFYRGGLGRQISVKAPRGEIYFYGMGVFWSGAWAASRNRVQKFKKKVDLFERPGG